MAVEVLHATQRIAMFLTVGPRQKGGPSEKVLLASSLQRLAKCRIAARGAERLISISRILNLCAAHSLPYGDDNARMSLRPDDNHLQRRCMLRQVCIPQ